MSFLFWNDSTGHREQAKPDAGVSQAWQIVVYSTPYPRAVVKVHQYFAGFAPISASSSGGPESPRPHDADIGAEVYRRRDHPHIGDDGTAFASTKG
jgi:hypothetical protein